MTEPPDLSRTIGRGILVFALAAMTVAIYLFSCRARGQEAPVMLGVEVVYDPPTNQVIERRSAQPFVPPIPQLKQRTITRTTNSEQEVVTVIVEKPVPPAPLIQDKPRTNAFWASCPECKVRAIRAPLRIQVVGSRAVTGGDELERLIYFRCCNQEFKRRNFKFVEEEIAIEVPVKGPQH